MREFTGKMPGTRLCASLRNRNAQGHLTRAISCKIYGKNATKPMAYPDLTPALTPTVRALSVDALFGELNERFGFS